jgi:transposase-like protein
MTKKHDKNEKQALMARYLSSESVASILEGTNLSGSTFYSWLKQYHDEQQSDNSKEIDPKTFACLNARLSGWKASYRYYKQ